MKSIYLLCGLLFLYSCAIFGSNPKVDYNINMVKPNEIGMGEELSGRVFTINCTGNEYDGVQEVENLCRKYVSEFSYQQGYNYFTILNSNRNSQTSTNTYTTRTPVNTYYKNSKGESAYYTTYVPQNTTYNVTKHSLYYMFVLIKEDEKEEWKNYYKVSDYYGIDPQSAYKNKITY